jgi:hypothetical protein
LGDIPQVNSNLHQIRNRIKHPIVLDGANLKKILILIINLAIQEKPGRGHTHTFAL